jgi:hypothetical protein
MPNCPNFRHLVGYLVHLVQLVLLVLDETDSGNLFLDNGISGFIFG